MEADLVAHKDPSASGSFVQTLTLTDVATSWTECAPLLFREQRLLSEVMTALPFPLLGFDTDIDGVFMNETIKDWCEAAQGGFTRSRPYRKTDQAHAAEITASPPRAPPPRSAGRAPETSRPGSTKTRHTPGALPCRLQAAHPDAYPDELIRTVQRRAKIWRGDMPRSLVFGANGDAHLPMTPDCYGSGNLREQAAEATA